jgi:hypothetical protein
MHIDALQKTLYCETKKPSNKNKKRNWTTLSMFKCAIIEHLKCKLCPFYSITKYWMKHLN